MSRKQNSQVAVVTFFPLDRCEELDREMVTMFRRSCSLESYDYAGRNLIRSWYLSSLSHGREPLVSSPATFGVEFGYEPQGEAYNKLRIMLSGIRGHFRGRYDPRSGKLTALFVNHEDMDDTHETNLYMALFNRHRLRPKSEPKVRPAAEGILWEKTQDVEASASMVRHEERYAEHVQNLRDLGVQGVHTLAVRENQCRTILNDEKGGVFHCGLPIQEGSRHRFCTQCSKRFLVPIAKPSKRGFRLQKLSAA